MRTCAKVIPGTHRVVPDMRRTAKPKRLCRRCPFRAPSGQCLDLTIKSGRCGDWIWFVRYGKRIRRPYVRPRDPRTPAQLRSRARLSAASKNYSYSLTEKQRTACISAGAKLRSCPRLCQSGPLTGQQVLDSQAIRVTESTWERHQVSNCTTSASTAEG